MKKKYNLLAAMIVLLAIAMPFNLKAQDKVWSIGPEAGVSVSKYGRDADPNEIKPGGILGVFVTYSIVNTFAITAKTLFHQKGASFESNDTKQTLQYIEMPVVGRFFFNKEGNIRPNVFVGPSWNFLIGAKNKIGSENSENIDSFKDSFNTVDVGITGGAGVNIRILNETYLVLDARYTHGLTDISDGGDDVNNTSLALTAGVSFGF